MGPMRTRRRDLDPIESDHDKTSVIIALHGTHSNSKSAGHHTQNSSYHKRHKIASTRIIILEMESQKSKTIFFC